MTTIDSRASANASSVYLFQNGYGMIVKTITFPSNDSHNRKDTVEVIVKPSSVMHGTFWIHPTSNQIVIKSVRAKKVHTFVEKECLTIEDLVEGNIGQQVYLQIKNDSSTNRELVFGKIRSVQRTIKQSNDDDKENPPLPRPMPLYHSHDTVVPNVNLDKSIQQGNLVLVETTDDGLLAVPLSNIQSIRGTTLKTSYQRKMLSNRLSIEYKNQSNTNQTGLMKYLTSGLTWVPSYSLTFVSTNESRQKILRLSLKVVILNDIENMNVNKLYCVAGSPNPPKFFSIIDPIFSEDNIHEFLKTLTLLPYSFHNRSSSTVSSRFRVRQPSSMHASTTFDRHAFPPNFSSPDSDGDDLHFYEFHNVLLQKTERLILPIFEIDLQYKDVYYCEIGEAQPTEMFEWSRIKKDIQDVWYSVQFANRSNYVWTSAPVVITKGLEEQQFIGEDILTYTERGSTALVNITKAYDVRVKWDEGEMKTDPNLLGPDSYFSQYNQFEGQLTITNYKNETATIVIVMILAGDIINFTVEPKKRDMELDEFNVYRQHKVQWELTVESKNMIEIKYNRAYNTNAYRTTIMKSARNRATNR